MSDFRLTVLLAILPLYFHIDGTNGVFFHISRSFPPVASQHFDTEQENADADFHVPPFLPFFPFLRPQNPFLHSPHLEGKERNDGALSSEKIVESKENTTLLGTTKGVASELDSRKNKTANVPEYFASRNLNPFEKGSNKPLLDTFPLHHFRHWRFEEAKAPGQKKSDDQLRIRTTTDSFNNTSDEEKSKFEGQGHRVFQRIINPNGEADRNYLTGKYPLGMAANNSLLMDTENCTRRQFVTRYFFIWTINWTSLITHLTVVLLILALITCGLFLCRPYCENGEQVSKLLKVKALNV